MKVAIGSDHGGFTLKEALIRHMQDQGITVEDFGTHSTDSCDYPVFAKKAAEAVANGACERGIVVCTTGIGVSMVANKVKGIRCAVCTDPTVARMTRLHNDANMIALGGGIIGELIAKDIVDTFLNTPFSEEDKHIRRVGMIEETD